MKNIPLISVIMTFLNGEKFIVSAIESAINQTYDNWELLLVDDGSTDNSSNIALHYARTYPEKVFYLEHEGHQNLGRCIARNLGIDSARGEFIAFLDADDIWLPEKLEKQLQIIKSYPEAAMIFGHTVFWFSWTGHFKDASRDHVRPLRIQPNKLYYPPELFTLLLQTKVNTPATCSVLIRREVFDKIGKFDDSLRDIFEDVFFFGKIFHKLPVYVTSECWDKYRQHPDSTCAIAQKTGEYHPSKSNSAHLALLNTFADYLSQEAVKENEIWLALEKAYFPYKYPQLYLLQFIFRDTWNYIKYKLYRIRKFIVHVASSRIIY